MKRISVELVPRDEDALRGELALLGKFKEQVDVINIPDLLRFPTRSWQGAAIAKEYFPESMPHIRAMDIDLDKELAMKDYLREHDIREVLVIEGDPPQDMMHEVYPTNSVDVIWKFRKEMPEVKVCKADVDEERDLAIEHGIESIPTLLIFRGGEIAGKLVGYRDKQSLRAEIEEKL